MEQWLRDHMLSAGIVLLVVVLVIMANRDRGQARAIDQWEQLRPFLALSDLDTSDPLHRALLKESLAVFYPDSAERTASLMEALDAYHREQYTNPQLKTGAAPLGLSWDKVHRLTPMYLNFILVYLVVLVLTYYGVQTAGLYRYVRLRQGAASPLAGRWHGLTTTAGGRSFPLRMLRVLPAAGRALVKGTAYVILFAPAYVIAYSLKTRFESDSWVFLIGLAVVSNGFLISYTGKFTTFLIHEGRKGYVETALVKNLHASYHWGTTEGISIRSLLAPRKRFPFHLLQHVFTNARFQYIPTVKEQASFLITSLMIIEMALNIQGHLCYELLQKILYHDYEIAAGIILALFLLIKATEIVIDLWSRTASRHYGILHAGTDL